MPTAVPTDAEEGGFPEHEPKHVAPRRTDAAQEPDLLPPRRDAGGDRARHDEDGGQERESGDAREQRAVGAQDALDLLAAPRGPQHLDAGRQRGPHGALGGVDVHVGCEGDVDLIDQALATEDGLGTDHVHQEEVAAERASDAARGQDAAHRERADADRRAQPQRRAHVGVHAAGEDVGEDDARRVDEEGERIVDDAVAGADQTERLDGMAVGDVGGEDGERLAGRGPVDDEEGVGEDRDRVLHAREVAQALGDRLGKGTTAAYLERRRAGQVLDGVREGTERTRVDDLDCHHERNAAGDARRGERGARPVAAQLAAGEEEEGHQPVPPQCRRDALELQASATMHNTPSALPSAPTAKERSGGGSEDRGILHVEQIGHRRLGGRRSARCSFSDT